MKQIKIIMISVIFTLICSGLVYAETEIQGKSIWFNKKELASSSNVIIENNLYLSAGDVADKFQALLAYDDITKKVDIFKPNIHMLTMKKTEVLTDVKQNSQATFIVFAQIDTLKVDIDALKVTISDPYGDETLIEERRLGDKNFPGKGKESFWITTKDITYKFNSAGNYTIRFWMKPADNDSMQVVSEKVIFSN